MMEKTTTEKQEPVREVFEIPSSRCREEVVVAGVQARCPHLHEHGPVNPCQCGISPMTGLDRARLTMAPLRRTDGVCPFGVGPIRMTIVLPFNESERAIVDAMECKRRRKALDTPMTLREYDNDALAPLKYGPPTGGKR